MARVCHLSKGKRREQEEGVTSWVIAWEERETLPVMSRSVIRFREWYGWLMNARKLRILVGINFSGEDVLMVPLCGHPDKLFHIVLPMLRFYHKQPSFIFVQLQVTWHHVLIFHFKTIVSLMSKNTGS